MRKINAFLRPTYYFDAGKVEVNREKEEGQQGRVQITKLGRKYQHD
jgi:hypothetical protein